MIRFVRFLDLKRWIPELGSQTLDRRSWDTASRSACDAFGPRCHTTLGDSSNEEDEVPEKENWKEAAGRGCGAGGSGGLTKDEFDGFR